MEKIFYLLALSLSFYKISAQKVELKGTKWCFVLDESDGKRTAKSPLISVKFNANNQYKWGEEKGKYSTELTDDSKGYRTLTLQPDGGLRRTYKVKHLDANYFELYFNGISNHKYVLVVCNDLSTF